MFGRSQINLYLFLFCIVGMFNFNLNLIWYIMYGHSYINLSIRVYIVLTYLSVHNLSTS